MLRGCSDVSQALYGFASVSCCVASFSMQISTIRHVKAVQTRNYPATSRRLSATGFRPASAEVTGKPATSRIGPHGTTQHNTRCFVADFSVTFPPTCPRFAADKAAGMLRGNCGNLDHRDMSRWSVVSASGP